MWSKYCTLPPTGSEVPPAKWIRPVLRFFCLHDAVSAPVEVEGPLTPARHSAHSQVKASSQNGSQDSDSDDDFDEVPEKEGYEPYIPEHLRAEYGESMRTHAHTPGGNTCKSKQQPCAWASEVTCCHLNPVRFTHTLQQQTVVSHTC